MKRISILIAMALTALNLEAKNIVINTPNTSLVLSASEGKTVNNLYYGARLANPEELNHAGLHTDPAYPAFGNNKTFRNYFALAVTHSNGDMSTELTYIDDSCSANPDGSTTYTIRTADTLRKLEVDLCYKTWNNCDVIEMWTVIRNAGKKEIVLEKYASGALPFRQGDVWVSHEHGAWGAEAFLTEEPLTAGHFEVCDLQGVKNAFKNRPNIMISLDGKPREDKGRTYGAVLCWSGNFKMSIDTEGHTFHHLICGINEVASRYHLGKGETFTTPVMAVVYSEEGKGGVSRNYHRWARKNGWIHNGEATRLTLLNSWEGVYLNVSQEGMTQMMDGLKELGGELFVMDDGWFGNKYKRSVDNCALGDWVTDFEKLPAGVPALEKAATERGLKWGIWIEPEMTNSKSELYEKHPDWVICHPDRNPVYGRGKTQLILDMSNPEVQDFVFKVVDDIMTETPNTHYIKWDCNMEIYSFGSHYLSADRQSHLYVDYQLGLIKTLERIRAKYPNLVIQNCASGGGRVNYGLMPYFDEFWTSDNTDAEQRLFIQWGTSMFFPPCAMAQHVSASPNHQTGRHTPLKFRFDVAMTGRLGMEMKPSDLSPEEMEFAKKAFATYKETIRPIVQKGDLYRLISPYEGTGFASEMFISEEKNDAVFFAYKFDCYVNQQKPIFRMAGLDPDARYKVEELLRAADTREEKWDGACFSGRFLMETGLELGLKGTMSSQVLKLTKVE